MSNKIFCVFLLSKIKKEDIGYVITTGPPLLNIKKKDWKMLQKPIPNIKWISDFRDPWSKLDLLQEFDLNKYGLRKHQKLKTSIR